MCLCYPRTIFIMGLGLGLPSGQPHLDLLHATLLRKKLLQFGTSAIHSPKGMICAARKHMSNQQSIQ